MGIVFSNIIFILKIENLSSSMSKIVNQTLSNCLEKILQSKNCLAALQINRNGYISTHSCALTILVHIAVH